MSHMSLTQQIFDAVKQGLNDRLEGILTQQKGLVDAKDLVGHASDKAGGPKIPTGRTALHWAASIGSNATVKILLKHGASVNARDDGGNTPLITAAGSTGASEVVETLLSVNNLEVDAKNASGSTALMESSKQGNYDTTKMILKSNRICIDNQDDDGNTALLHAVAAAPPVPQMILLLLEYGALRGLKNKYGQSADMFGQPQAPERQVFGEFPDGSRDKSLSQQVERDAGPAEYSSLDAMAHHRLSGVQWTLMGSPRSTIKTARAVGFSFLPKDYLVDNLTGKAVASALELAKRITDVPVRDNPFLWIHVPSNNVCPSSRF
jgi:hypothetical protein